tara:strand:+ start:92 stop:1030 length:939 start_codon:yes stop_codon:yes gene_type:complete
MSVELIVPTLGESITEATVSKWLKKIGEPFEVDEALVEIETDKITVEVPAPSSGSLSSINVKEGTDINIGGVLGIIEETSNSKSIVNEKKIDQEKQAEPYKQKNTLKEEDQSQETKEENSSIEENKIQSPEIKNNILKLSPAVKKMVIENKLDINLIKSSREDGRLTKEDILNYMSGPKNLLKTSDREESVRMSKIRRTIATRLKDAQNTAAILTTFNEVDMSEIIKVRDLKKDDFMDRYAVKLGFMSFFVKAVVMSLQEFPAVNSEIRDDNIIYKNHFDIGIAVGTEKGLVVPVLKNANDMTFGDIEKKNS